MNFIKIKAGDIRESVGESYYSRGLMYYIQKKVLMYNNSTHIDQYGDEVLFIKSRVKGSSGHIYNQSIEIYKDSDDEIIIEGYCSCPVNYNCKHCAAVCLNYMADLMEKNYKNRALQNSHEKDTLLKKWLENLKNKSSEPLVLRESDYILIYRLNDVKSYVKGTVALYQSKRLKSGSLSKGTKIDLHRIMHNYSYRELKSVEDEDILQLLKIFLTDDYHPTFEKLSGTVGNIVLKKMVKTGRCFYDQEREPLRLSEEKFEAECTFKLYKQEYSLKTNFLSDDYTIFETDPPLLVDKKRATMQELNISLNEYKDMKLAPKIPKEQIQEVLETLVEVMPVVKVTTPKSIKVKKIEVLPRARLQLKGDNSFIVDFLYDDVVIAYKPQILVSSFYKDTNKFEIKRDLEQEEKYKKIIEDFGFHTFLKENNIAVQLAESPRQKELQIWNDFLNVGIAKIEEEGWEIVRDEAFSLAFENDSEVVVESETSNNWFELSFNLEFNGHSQPIAPLISKIISEFNDLKDIPETLSVEVKKNHFVSIQKKQIEPILKTIIELFDKQQDDNSLKISAYDAHLIDFMDDTIVWRGSKEILELSGKLKDFQGIKNVAVPNSLQATLREYQQEGLNWLNFLYEFKFGGILADDMGLGKTIQTLAHLSRLKEQKKLTKPSLIIVPTSLVANWKNEAKKFTPNLNLLVLHGNERTQHFDEIQKSDLVVTTYSLVTRDKEILQEYNFCYIILDEAQKIKNPKTKMAITIKTLNSEYRLALSGTPIENHLGELWSIFSFLMPGFLDTLSFFKKYYQIPIEKEHDFQRQLLLNKRVKPFMLRRTKEIVASELPKKSEIVKYTQFDAQQSKLYESIRVTMEKKVQEAVKEKGIGSSHITILDALLKLRQVCCDPSLLKIKEAQKVKESAKLTLFLDLIDELMQEGRKVLVFSQFTTMLQILEDQISAKGITYAKLTGSTTKREEQIEKFTKGDAKIFLISLKAGGVGLNLVEADSVIHYDPWWNPAVENQATDRAYRIGQTKAVFVYKLIVENTIEQKILELQKRKKAIEDSLYDENKQQEDLKFSGDELLELLR